jgi:hypothetical protein
MKHHHYRITLEQLEPLPPETAPRQLRFDFNNHDDIFAILERIGQHESLFSPQEANQLALGLKLFGAVVMESKAPLFATFKPHLVDFIRTLKTSLKKPAVA